MLQQREDVLLDIFSGNTPTWTWFLSEAQQPLDDLRQSWLELRPQAAGILQEGSQWDQINLRPKLQSL